MLYVINGLYIITRTLDRSRINSRTSEDSPSLAKRVLDKTGPSPVLSRRFDDSGSKSSPNLSRRMDESLPVVSGHVPPSSGTGLRNESYLQATQDTFLSDRGHSTTVNQDDPTIHSPTVNGSNSDTLIIQPDYTSNNTAPKINTLNYTNADDVCNSSFETNAVGFSRDQPGRRSMSEKRHASIDARNTDTYRRAK